jgi:hypothetical protein
LQQLTTPEIIENDAVFPGENWFFYWKTSPSLWESKLKQYNGANPIFVPIYWGLHSEYSDQFDFGEHKPETNLKRLYECSQNVGKELIFLICLTPAPFLINGGIPSYLARNLSKNREDIAITVIDNSSRINRLYSFYDPKIFQSFRKFVYNVGQYFSHQGISSSVCGLDSMRMEDNHIVSFFKDHSQVFEGGYNRYVKQLQDSDPNKIERLLSDPSYENDLKREYSNLISSLYVDSSQEMISGNWGGVIKSCFIGGSTIDIFKRSFSQWETEKDYFEPLLKSVVNEIYPSSLLLDEKLKTGAFGKAINNIVDTSFVRNFLKNNYYEDDFSLTFQPLVFFELIDCGEGHFSFENTMAASGLMYYFEKEFPWSYKIKKEFEVEIEDIDPQSIFFFFGKRLDQKSFNKVLKLFMNGMRVFIDMAEIDIKLKQKLEAFFAENNIATEVVNYISPVTKASLGEGTIITYNSTNLLKTSLPKRVGFWETMVKFLNIKHLKVQADDEVEFFWKSRSSNSYELNYEEVRRVSFYNPTSYKKKAHIVSSQNFAFIKNVDQTNVEVHSTPIGIDISMKPGGYTTLDFGFYE